MDYTERLEAQMDEADRVDAANAEYLETLTPIELKKRELYRQLGYWKLELAASERSLMSVDDWSGFSEDFYKQRELGVREVARIKLEIEKLNLRDEYDTLKATWRLHEEGVRRIWARQDEIEKEMTAIDEKLRKAAR